MPEGRHGVSVPPRKSKPHWTHSGAACPGGRSSAWPCMSAQRPEAGGSAGRAGGTCMDCTHVYGVPGSILQVSAPWQASRDDGERERHNKPTRAQVRSHRGWWPQPTTVDAGHCATQTCRDRRTFRLACEPGPRCNTRRVMELLWACACAPVHRTRNRSARTPRTTHASVRTSCPHRSNRPKDRPQALSQKNQRSEVSRCCACSFTASRMARMQTLSDRVRLARAGAPFPNRKRSRHWVQGVLVPSGKPVRVQGQAPLPTARAQTAAGLRALRCHPDPGPGYPGPRVPPPPVRVPVGPRGPCRGLSCNPNGQRSHGPLPEWTIALRTAWKARVLRDGCGERGGRNRRENLR